MAVIRDNDAERLARVARLADKLADQLECAREEGRIVSEALAEGSRLSARRSDVAKMHAADAVKRIVERRASTMKRARTKNQP